MRVNCSCCEFGEKKNKSDIRFGQVWTRVALVDFRPTGLGAANTWPQLETQTENRLNRPRGRRKITLYSGSGSIFSKKHTKFCGNSYLNVQNINSSNSDEWTMSLCNAGKSLYLNGAFGL